MTAFVLNSLINGLIILCKCFLSDNLLIKICFSVFEKLLFLNNPFAVNFSKAPMYLSDLYVFSSCL